MIAMIAPTLSTVTATDAALLPGSMTAPAAPTTPAAPAAPTSALARRAMLVDLNVRSWTAKKKDQQATREVAQNHGADVSDAGDYIKRLLPKDALARISSAQSAARREHYARTLAWHDNGGGRVLANNGYFDYMAAMRACQRRIEEALDEFEVAYPGLIASAPKRLGSLHRADEYPSVATIRSHFGIEWKVLPMPAAEDFRVDMAEEEAAAIRADLEQQMAEKLAATQTELAERLKEVVGHVATRLREYVPTEQGGDSRLHPSMIENVRELLDLFPTLNLANDPTLDAIAAEVKSSVCRFSAQTLKDSSAARNKTADAAEEILAKLDDYI